MAAGDYDLAVVGSAPLAALLAGLLAGVHRKRVVLWGEAPSPLQPSRRFDLSVGPITRPQTWALLKRTSAETLRLLRTMERGLTVGVDALLVAETQAGREALGHVRHMAQGFGYPAEPSGEAVRIRGAWLLRARPFAAAAAAWLERSGVFRPPPGSMLTIRRDGSVRIEGGGEGCEAARALLCDDAAILAHVGPDGERLKGEQSAAFLAEPVERLAAPVIIDVDSGMMIAQRPSGAIEAAGPERARLAIGRPLRLAGRASFRSLASTDGAPVIATTRGRTALAGLGPIGAFLAPALARFLAGTASEAEWRWCEAHGTGKARSAVAELQAAA